MGVKRTTHASRRSDQVLNRREEKTLGNWMRLRGPIPGQADGKGMGFFEHPKPTPAPKRRAQALLLGYNGTIPLGGMGI